LGDVRIGSTSDNDLVVGEPTVSRHHAILHVGRLRLILEDLDSSNGTFVNGERIRGRKKVRFGDSARFGDARFVIAQPPPTAKQRYREVRRILRRERARSLRRRIVVIALFALVGFAIGQIYLYRAFQERAAKTIAARDPASAATTPSVAPSPVSEPTAAPQAAELAITPAVSEAAIALPEGADRRAPKEVAGAEWLERVNYYRRLANVAPVEASAVLDDGALKHARYLIENYAQLIRKGADLGAAAHDEDGSMRWYTPEGRAAAQRGNIYEGCGKLPKPAELIDGWINTPFHRLGIIDPRSSHAGYGMYERGGCWVAVLDLRRIGPVSRVAATSNGAVMFPGDRTEISLKSFDGSEWPAPLPGCPGYLPPVGLPITIQGVEASDIRVVSHSLRSASFDLESCVFTAGSYTNPDSGHQRAARSALEADRAIVVIPREPLQPGKTYQVSITTTDRTFRWSFDVI
jgi:uncharacterized protein YkwD